MTRIRQYFDGMNLAAGEGMYYIPNLSLFLNTTALPLLVSWVLLFTQDRYKEDLCPEAQKYSTVQELINVQEGCLGTPLLWLCGRRDLSRNIKLLAVLA